MYIKTKTYSMPRSCIIIHVIAPLAGFNDAIDHKTGCSIRKSQRRKSDVGLKDKRIVSLHLVA